MPARPSTNWADSDELVSQFDGETKFERAFWQVYSAMCTNGDVVDYSALAEFTIRATDAGFEALERKGEVE